MALLHRKDAALEVAQGRPYRTQAVPFRSRSAASRMGSVRGTGPSSQDGAARLRKQSLR